MDQITEKLKSLKEIIKEDSLAAATLYNEIFRLSTENCLDPKISEEAAELLADHIKTSSIFKQRTLMLHMKKFGLCAKIQVLRHFNNQFSSGFSFEGCLTKKYYIGTTSNGIMKLLKQPLECPMVYGSNQNGKLGCGSEEEFILSFRPLVGFKNNTISRAFIGEEHTIFFDGTYYYGSGKSANFQEVPVSEAEAIPTKLPFIEFRREWFYFGKKKIDSPRCTLTPTSTTFIDYNNNQSLIVGVPDGPNMKKVERIKVPKRLYRMITIPNSQGVDTQIRIIETTNQWCTKTRSERLVFIVCGALVDKKNLEGKVKYCDNGTIWLLNEGTLYTGTLRFMPRNKTAGQAKALVGVVEEVLLKYAVDNFDVSSDGKSCIVYPNRRKIEPIEPPINKFTLNNRHMEKIIRNLTLSNYHESMLENELANFKTCLDDESYEKFLHTGRLGKMAEKEVPILNALRYFIRFEDSPDIPQEIYEFVNEGNGRPGRWFHMRTQVALREGLKIEPVVVKAGWTREERLARLEQIQTYEEQYYAGVLSDIESTVQSLKNLPARYNQQEICDAFRSVICGFVQIASESGYDEDDDDEPPEVEIEKIKGADEKWINVEHEIRKRVDEGLIDGKEERFQLIRVEAVGVSKKRMDGIFYSSKTLRTHHHPFVTFTTLLHVTVIAKNLVPHIENGILNLNKACRGSEGDFQMYIAKLFGISKSCPRYKQICEASSENIIVATKDGVKTAIPRILVDIYFSKPPGTDENGEMSLNLSGWELEKLTEVLVNIRSVKGLEVEEIMKLLEFSREYGITAIQMYLVECVVFRSSEADYQQLRELFIHHPTETTRAISEKFPEAVLFWKNVPLAGNYMKALNTITSTLFQNQFVKMPNSKDINCSKQPLPLFKDTMITDGKSIDDEWIRNFLSDPVKDKDLEADLEKTLSIWNNQISARSVNRTVNRKRRHQ